MTNVFRMPTGGALRVSRITYFTDLLRSDTRELPVGVVAEVTLPGLCGIGVAMRTAYSEHELGLLGPAARALRSQPTERLWPDFKATFLNEGRSGRTLERLSERFSSSLSVLAPSALEVPRQWLLISDATRLQSAVEARLRVTLLDEYFKLFFPSRLVGEDEPAVEEELQRAA